MQVRQALSSYQTSAALRQTKSLSLSPSTPLCRELLTTCFLMGLAGAIIPMKSPGLSHETLRFEDLLVFHQIKSKALPCSKPSWGAFALCICSSVTRHLRRMGKRTGWRQIQLRILTSMVCHLKDCDSASRTESYLLQLLRNFLKPVMWLSLFIACLKKYISELSQTDSFLPYFQDSSWGDFCVGKPLYPNQRLWSLMIVRSPLICTFVSCRGNTHNTSIVPKSQV